jgi:hypothetical protein
LVLVGCGKSSEPNQETSNKQSDAVNPKDAKPEERKYLVAAKAFVFAVANREYDEAYAQFSSHAKARMSLNQFDPASDQSAFLLNEKSPVTDVTVEKFAELMKKVEELVRDPDSSRI